MIWIIVGAVEDLPDAEMIDLSAVYAVDATTVWNCDEHYYYTEFALFVKGGEQMVYTAKFVGETTRKPVTAMAETVIEIIARYADADEIIRGNDILHCALQAKEMLDKDK